MALRIPTVMATMQKPQIHTRHLWSRRMSVPLQEGQVAFSPKSDYLLLVFSEKAKAEYRAVLEVLAVAGDSVAQRLTFAGQLRTALWSPLNTVMGAVGTTVIEGEYWGVLCLWDVENGKLMELCRIGEERDFPDAAFAPDGKSLYLVTPRRIYTWDVAMRGVRRRITGEGQIAFGSIAVTTDGNTLAVGSGTKRQTEEGWTNCVVRLYDPVTGHQKRILPCPRAKAPTVVAFSPDSRLLVTGDRQNGDLIVYDLQSGKQAHTLKGNLGEVYTVTVSPNGKWIVTGGIDRNVRFWSLESGSPLTSLTRHDGAIRIAAFSPDGKYLATGDSNGELHLWAVEER